MPRQGRSKKNTFRGGWSVKSGRRITKAIHKMNPSSHVMCLNAECVKGNASEFCFAWYRTHPILYLSFQAKRIGGRFCKPSIVWGTSTKTNMYGRIPFRFPAGVHLELPWPVSEALFCRRAWDSPVVTIRDNTLLGSNDKKLARRSSQITVSGPEKFSAGFQTDDSA